MAHLWRFISLYIYIYIRLLLVLGFCPERDIKYWFICKMDHRIKFILYIFNY